MSRLIDPTHQEGDATMKRTLLIAGVATFLGVSFAAQAAGDPAVGKAKANACASCHGAKGEGVKPNPALAGKSEGEIVQAIKDYKSGKRANPVMKAMVGSVSDQDMANLGAYYASLKAK
jgi:cytochrome c553